MSTISDSPSAINIPPCPACGTELATGNRSDAYRCPGCWREFWTDTLELVGPRHPADDESDWVCNRELDDAADSDDERDDEKPRLSFEPVVSADGSGRWLSPHSGVILTNQNVLDAERGTRNWSLGFAEYRYYGGK